MLPTLSNNIFKNANLDSLQYLNNCDLFALQDCNCNVIEEEISKKKKTNRSLSLSMCRWCDGHGRFLDQVLPGGVRAEERAPARDGLLQVRQPGADPLHLLPLLRRPRLHLRRLPPHQAPRPPRHHHGRRRQLLPRRRRQRRRRQRRHAHRRPPPPRRRHRLRQPGRPPLPLRDRPLQHPRRRQPALPAHHLPRHPRRRRHQLLHRQDPPVGVEAVAGARHGPRHRDLRRRAVLAGDAQQPRRDGAAGGGEAGAGEGEGDEEGGRRVRGFEGGERGGEGGARHVQEPARRAQPAAAHHWGARDPGVPAAVRDELHTLLLAGHLPEPRLRQLRRALLLHHHGIHARRRRARLHGRRRPPRPQIPLHRGRHPDDLLHGQYTTQTFLDFSLTVLGGLTPARCLWKCLGGGGGDPGAQVRARRGAIEGRGHGAGGGDLPVRGGLRVVVGAAGVAGAERAVPAGDEVGGAERGGVRQPVLDGGGGAVLPRRHVPPPVGGVHPLRRAHRRHVHLRHPPPAGDQAGAHRGDLDALRQALVLEAHRQEGPQVSGPPPPPDGRHANRRRRRRQVRLVGGLDDDDNELMMV